MHCTYSHDHDAESPVTPANAARAVTVYRPGPSAASSVAFQLHTPPVATAPTHATWNAPSFSCTSMAAAAAFEPFRVTVLSTQYA